MKRLKYIYNKVWAFSLLCALSTACSDDLSTGGREIEDTGLVMQLQIDGNAVLTPSVATRIAADPTLNETLVKHVDVFFSTDGNSIDTDHYIHSDMGADNRIVLAGADWKTQFPATSYQVYVVANLHTYDNPATSDNVETDLSWITTVDQLRALTDTDNKVCHAEGETILGTSESDNTTYSDKTFLMDGAITWTPPSTDDATIEVDLKRAAAKIVVNVRYADGKDWSVTDEDGISIVTLRKKMVNYVPQAKALAEAPYQEMEVMGDAGTSGFSNPDYTNEGSDANRIDILYAYTYPNQWGDNMERETYLLVNIPYNDGNDYYNQNYYKVPVRFSADADELRLDRNMQYTVNVTIDRKGNEEIDEPVTLKPTFNVEPWKTVNIDVDNSSPNYLVLSDYDIELHNEDKVTIEFYSSTPLAGTNANPAGVRITKAYFINKDGEETIRQLIEEADHYWEDDVYKNVADFCSVNWDENTLTGTITFHGDIPTNVTARYVTLEVRNTDIDPVTGQNQPTTRTVEITQYPLEYIMGVPGWYSTRSDFTADWEDHGDLTGVKTEFNNRPTVSNSIFNSKYYDEDDKDIYRYGSQRIEEWNGWNRREYYTIEYSSDPDDNDNNRMYLVQLTSTNANYTIARPQIDVVVDNDNETGTDIQTAIGDENNQVVSPAFMLASQLGTVSNTSNWRTAQEHCRKYVEVIKYDEGQPPTRVLSDWRLPTFAELKIIAKYQNEQPDIMDEVLGGARYWSADSYMYLETSNPDADDPTESEPNRRGEYSTSCYIRCIRDVTPDDLKEFAAHGIR